VPTLDQLLNLKTVSASQISPDGKYVAYTVNQADFKQDAFINQIWLADVATQRRVQLTRADKGATNPQWSPNGEWLAFQSDRVENKSQLFAISPNGGEAVQLTKSETPISNFAWAPDGKSIVYTATEPVAQLAKDRKDHLGDFEVVRREYQFVQLWTLSLDDAMAAPMVGKQRTKGTTMSVDAFAISPDSRKIVFSAQLNPDLINGFSADIYLLDLADDRVTKLPTPKGPNRAPRFSPDGTQIVFSSALGKPMFYAGNSRLVVMPLDGGNASNARSVTDSFDEIPALLDWKPDGIYFSGLVKTASHLFRVDPATSVVTRVSAGEQLMASSFSMTKDARQIAFVSPSPTALAEVFVTDREPFRPKMLTQFTDQTKNLITASREVIQWKSKDGPVIEGILIKPADFDPNKKYPLLCIIHGGPTGVDRPTHLDTRYYPSDIWAARGALLLKVNYRGSAGYGEKFRMLNIRNLGVGDAWDVLSGIDYLVSKGWVDTNKVASMGWSQGGYISAFLTASSNRFAAISVGAGISDWSTYYYNTDVTPFTIQYLGANPVDDPAIYQKTSPISYIKAAKTPTLIQHGELDKRVPIANAYELRQALEDRSVKSEMIVYKGFGHGITKPKSQRAVMEHNLLWFNHYLWGDPLPDFAKPTLPAKEVKPKTGSEAKAD
jgi:dipeptidyl aminopeptidase/acylaminoacyl peptidase